MNLLALLRLFLSTEKRDFSTFSYTSTSEIDFVDRVSVLKPTLTLICHLGQNVGLGEEQVGSFPETYNDFKKLRPRFE